MKKIRTLLIFCSCLVSGLTTTSFGQMAPLTFGKISLEEAQMNSYAKDPLADAVVLFDIGKTRFVPEEGSLDIQFERTTRIKIFKQSALNYAEVEIPYYSEGNTSESVKEIEAYTYNYTDGTFSVTKLNPSNIYDEKINNYWRMKKFALPEVREGSVIEYRYVLKTPFKLKFRDWEFQRKIPTIYSNFIVRMTPFYEYSLLMQGASKFTTEKDYTDTGIEQSFAGIKYEERVHEYTMTDVPAFRSEDYITSINDYIIKLSFQLSVIHHPDGAKVDVVKTWPALIKELDTDESFGKYLNKVEKSASKIIDIEKCKKQAPKERFDNIVQFVKSNYNWNEFKGMYAYESLNKFLDQKSGNTGNINLMLTGLLSAAGLEAYPLILSTRENGKIRDTPFLDFFNYTVAAVIINDTVYLADATETFTPSDVLPIRCINDKGLLIKRDVVKWIPLAVNDPSLLKNTFDIHLSSQSDTLNATLTIKADGYLALALRDRYYNKKEKLVEDCVSSGYIVESDSIKIEDMIEPDSVLTIKIPIKMETEQMGNRILISPFLKEPISKNKLVEDSRTYPIDFIFPDIYSYECKISLPENLKVVSLPAEDKINNPGFSFVYKATTEGNIVYAKGEYQFKKSIYKPTDYNLIKFYFNEIIKVLNSQVAIEVD
jgi:hypothetical protein